MTDTSSFALLKRNPDVLTCIANLSNDEVFTPPEFAARMLDTLAEGWATANGGANLWADSTVTFLDPCTVETIWDGQPTGPAVPRYLDEFDVLVRRNEAVPILQKVKARGEATLDARVSSQKPFGLRTFFHGKSEPTGLAEPIKLFGSQKISWVKRSEILANDAWIDKWKVLMTRVQGTSAAVETKFLSRPIVAEPGTACTESYIVAGLFDTESEAKNYATYLRTRFARFLVSLRKATQDAPKNVYGFIPDLPMNKVWTDAKLYERYSLSPSEIAFVESQVAEHNDAQPHDE